MWSAPRKPAPTPSPKPREASSRSSERDAERQADRVAISLYSGSLPSSVPDAASLPAAPSGAARSGAVPADVRRPVEERLGVDLSHVRAHADAHGDARARGEGAMALSASGDLYFAAGLYRPDLPLGRALIHHELTHAAQQIDPGRIAAAERAHAAEEAPLPMAESKPLRFFGCKRHESTPQAQPQEAAPPEPDPQSEEGLQRRISQEADPQSDEARRLRIQLALTQRRWAEAATLVRARPALVTGDHRMIVAEAISGGEQGLRVEAGSDAAFRGWVRQQLFALAMTPSGFLLLLDLLASGQTVVLRPTTGAATTSPPPLTGLLQVATPTQPQLFQGQPAQPQQGTQMLSPDTVEQMRQHYGAARPVGEQVHGSGAGSTISLNPNAGPQFVVGEVNGTRTLIPIPESLVLGHELIHALHNARGENVRAREATDPGTGGLVNAEELVTILGPGPLTRRDPDPSRSVTERYALTTRVSENVLRDEMGLGNRRISHAGGDAVRVTVAADTTNDALAGRYRLSGAPVTGALRAHIVNAIAMINPAPAAGTPASGERVLPSPGLVLIYVRDIARDAATAATITPPTESAPSPLTLP